MTDEPPVPDLRCTITVRIYAIGQPGVDLTPAELGRALREAAGVVEYEAQP